MAYIEFGGQSRSLGPGVLTVGSGPEAGWRILDHDLVPVHALVSLESSGHALIARGSASATVIINGSEIVSGWHTLQYGDSIRLGSAELHYMQFARAVAGINEGYLKDTRRNRVYKLGEFSEIGRDLHCSVLLQEPDVSRTHLEIRAEGEGFVVRPRGAVTLLNGNRLIAPSKLDDGDELTVGRTKLRFSKEMPVQAQAAPAVPTRNIDKRVARQQTTFMGVVEMREQLQRTSRRKIRRTAAAVIAVAALIAALVSIIQGRGPSVSVGTRANATPTTPAGR